MKQVCTIFFSVKFFACKQAYEQYTHLFSQICIIYGYGFKSYVFSLLKSVIDNFLKVQRKIIELSIENM